MRTIVYIDAFNFYHGCLEGNNSCKWLDLKSFFESLLKANSENETQIVKIKYFTTKIRSYIETKGNKRIPINALAEKQKRQQVYLRALKAHAPEIINIYIGRFSSYPVEWPLADKPSEKVEVMRTEEKMTDVSLATHMLNDAWLDSYDCAILVSSDSDMITAIELIKHNALQKKIAHKEIGLITPAVNEKREVSKRLKDEADFTIKIKSKKLLEKCQLPEKIPTKDKGKFIYRPEKWK